MIVSSQILRDIVRPCSVCEIAFDSRLHSPHILPCAHTFCLMCLSKSEQRKKRHCFECKTKYNKYFPNFSLIEAIKRIEERRQWIENELLRCDECDNRVPIHYIRQCETCENQFPNRAEYPLECVICLECCVNSHNSHKLFRVYSRQVSRSPSPILKHNDVRQRQHSTSSAVSVHFRSPSQPNHRFSPKGIINTIKSWSFRSSSTNLPFLLTPQSKLAFSEEDVVMQCNTPFYGSQNMSIGTNRKLSSTTSSRRVVYIDSSNRDNISDDSVFEPRSDSDRSPLTTSSNDSGIRMDTPPRLMQRASHSSTSLKQMPAVNANKLATISAIGVRPRIRMGVNNIGNNSNGIYQNQQPYYVNQKMCHDLKSYQSENSVFVAKKSSTESDSNYECI